MRSLTTLSLTSHARRIYQFYLLYVSAYSRVSVSAVLASFDSCLTKHCCHCADNLWNEAHLDNGDKPVF
jgi:hypothetical protein